MGVELKNRKELIPVHACLRCGGSTIDWEIYEWGKVSFGRKCIACGKVSRLADILRAEESAKNGGVEVADPEQLKGGEKRLCKDCGDKPTMSPNCPFCSSCMRKRAMAARELKKKAGLQPDQGRKPVKTHSQGKAPSVAGDPARGGISAITVNFEGHIEVLNQIKELAAKEIRSVDHQIIYILKGFLEKDKGRLSEV